MSLSIFTVNGDPNKEKTSFKDHNCIVNLSIYEALLRNYWILISPTSSVS